MRFFIFKFIFLFVFIDSGSIFSQTITLVKNLDFGFRTQGVAATVTIAPTDAGAAVFNATGMIPGRTATCKVTNSSITMTNGTSGTNNQITVNTFRINGCTAVVPATGQILNIGVGARASITTAKVEGVYTGPATFRITTN